MQETMIGLRRLGLTRSQKALLVRDFLELVPLGEPAALAPFLHPDVRFESSDCAVATGRDAVLAVWSSVVRRFDSFGLDVVSVVCESDRVLVEQRMLLSLHPRARAVPLLGFAAFDLRDAQIVGWRQLSG